MAPLTLLHHSSVLHELRPRSQPRHLPPAAIHVSRPEGPLLRCTVLHLLGHQEPWPCACPPDLIQSPPGKHLLPGGDRMVGQLFCAAWLALCSPGSTGLSEVFLPVASPQSAPARWHRQAGQVRVSFSFFFLSFFLPFFLPPLLGPCRTGCAWQLAIGKCIG